MNIVNLSSSQLRRAAQIKDQIAKLEAELSKLLGASTPSSAKPVAKGRGKLSAAARKKISQAAKARWAKVKAAGKKKL